MVSISCRTFNFLKFGVVVCSFFNVRADLNISQTFFASTVILVRPKTGESAQLSFSQKFVGEFFSIWANFVQCPVKNLLIWEKLAQIGKISPENFWGEI
jgi:hypothetical protein